MKEYTFDITPVTKPRMTRRDKWLNPPRPRVARYWAYKDELNYKARLQQFTLPDYFHIDFYLPMPVSWSKKKKEHMDGRSHQQTPDRDNLEKAFADALKDQDCTIWGGEVNKYWAREGKIVVRLPLE